MKDYHKKKLSLSAETIRGLGAIRELRTVELRAVVTGVGNRATETCPTQWCTFDFYSCWCGQ